MSLLGTWTTLTSEPYLSLSAGKSLISQRLHPNAREVSFALEVLTTCDTPACRVNRAATGGSVPNSRRRLCQRRDDLSVVLIHSCLLLHADNAVVVQVNRYAHRNMGGALAPVGFKY